MAALVASALLGNLVAAYPVPCTWLATEWWTVEASTCSVSLPGFLTAWLLELSHNNPATCQAAPSGACGDCKRCCCFLTMSYGIWLVEHWVAWVFLEQLDVSYNQLVHLSMDFSATLDSAYSSHNLLANVDPCSLWGLGNLEQLHLSHSLATVWGPLLPTLALAHWEPAAASWDVALATMPGLEVLWLGTTSAS